MKRVKVAYEPVLKIHRYVMVFHSGRKKKYVYCQTRQEVREARAALMLKAPQNAFLEVFKAEHNFTEAWVKA